MTRYRVTRGICAKVYATAAMQDRRAPVHHEPAPFRMAYITEGGERIERKFHGSPGEILDQLKAETQN